MLFRTIVLTSAIFRLAAWILSGFIDILDINICRCPSLIFVLNFTYTSIVAFSFAFTAMSLEGFFSHNTDQKVIKKINSSHFKSEKGL
jgi:hypothetical protein